MFPWNVHLFELGELDRLVTYVHERESARLSVLAGAGSQSFPDGLEG